MKIEAIGVPQSLLGACAMARVSAVDLNQCCDDHRHIPRMRAPMSIRGPCRVE
jgi:hypothetical protein